MAPSFKAIHLNPYGNSIVYISLIIIATLFVDLLFTRLPFYGYKIQTSPYTIIFLIVEVLIFATFQYLYLKLVHDMVSRKQKQGSTRLSFKYVDKGIAVAQILLIIILAYIIGEIVMTQAYHTILISMVVWISCTSAILILGTLIFRFIQWFKISHDRLILSYVFAMGLIILNCGVILAYINTSLESRPNTIASTRPAINNAHALQIPLNNTYTLTSFLSFIGLWAATIFSLRGYSGKIGRIKFWLAISLPLLYFLSQSEFIFGPFILSHRFLDPISFFRIYTISFASTKLVGGIMFAIPYYLVSRKISDPKVRNYLKLTSIGLILLFLSMQVFSLPLLPYPPFGIVAISFLGLSSYLILVGIYGSAISVSEDSMLRRSIRKLVIKETELVDTFATAQMEREIQSKVVETTKRLSRYITEETGIESSLKEEDIKKYCMQVLAEIKRK
jgi:hypothetical protein